MLQFSPRCGALTEGGKPPLAEWLALSNAYHEVAAVLGWERAIEFGMRVWETKRPPSHRRTGAGDRRGAIYIPSSIGDFAGTSLVSIVGHMDAVRLVDRLGGSYLQFSDTVPASIARRNEAVAQQVTGGFSVASVAACFDLSRRQVRRIAKTEADRHVQ